MFLFLLAMLAAEISFDWRWYNLVWIIYIILWLPWPVCLRAALIDQHGPILHEPKITSAFAWLLAIISYAGAGWAFFIIGLGVLALLGDPSQPEYPDYIWTYLGLLAVFAAGTFFGLRYADRPKRGKVILLFFALMVIWAIVLDLLAG
jgi:hypothetical protein